MMKRAGIPLLVLHDFDKAGFSILGTLIRDTRRYSFGHDHQVIDLGLRLEDAKRYDLQSEVVAYGKMSPRKVRANLEENGATSEELDFLCPVTGGSGLRVELNAFTSSQMIEWLEEKLTEHGIEKTHPDSGSLEAAFRRGLELEMVREQLKAIQADAADRAASAPLPEGLSEQVGEVLDCNPSRPWDGVVADIAKKQARKLEEKHDSSAGDSAC